MGAESKSYTLEEVSKHNNKKDAWIILDDKVYNITNWIPKHPGGVVLSTVLGQDATDVMHAMHPKGDESIKSVEKYMKAYEIGTVQGLELPAHVVEFRQLRKLFLEQGLFKSEPMWWAYKGIEIIFWYFLGYVIMELWADPNEESRLRFWLVALCFATAQIQAGWTQHDFGHMAVFPTQTLNQIGHQFFIGLLKGASSQWWKSRHNRHHSKPNEIGTDPDIQNEPLFYFNEASARRHREKDPKSSWVTSKMLPYQWYYWWLIGPPIVTTFLLPLQMFLYMQRSSRPLLALTDLVPMFLHHYIFGLVAGTHYSFWNGLCLYYAMRFIESHWFTWVTSMSHLPMPFHFKKETKDFIALQFYGTQNLAYDEFTTWFSGHLNYQIEHHLFPSMPRYNYPLIAKRIQTYAHDHSFDYPVKSMPQACKDILNRLDTTASWWSKEKVQ